MFVEKITFRDRHEERRKSKATADYLQITAKRLFPRLGGASSCCLVSSRNPGKAFLRVLWRLKDLPARRVCSRPRQNEDEAVAAFEVAAFHGESNKGRPLIKGERVEGGHRDGERALIKYRVFE